MHITGSGAELAASARNDRDGRPAATAMTARADLVELERFLRLLERRAEEEAVPLERAAWDDEAVAVRSLIHGLRTRLGQQPGPAQAL